MKEKIIEILTEIRPGFEFNDPMVHFIEAGYFDSFDIISIVVDLESAFDLKISGAAILPENFKSIGAITNLIQNSKNVSQV